MRIHDLLFELLMGPKLSMKHGHPISFNCTFTLYKKSKSNSLLKVNEYNVLEIKQTEQTLAESLSQERCCTAQLGLGWTPATCQQLQDTLPSPRAGSAAGPPIPHGELWGNSLLPSPAGVWFLCPSRTVQKN